MRVVIADQSSMVLGKLSAALSEIEGIEVIGQTTDAQTAVDFVRRLGPEIVIMDIRLNGAGGTYALSTIKQCDPPPIVLVFTNHTLEKYREQCMDAGADGFFTKSSEFRTMLATLEGFMAPARPASTRS